MISSSVSRKWGRCWCRLFLAQMPPLNTAPDTASSLLVEEHSQPRLYICFNLNSARQIVLPVLVHLSLFQEPLQIVQYEQPLDGLKLARQTGTQLLVQQSHPTSKKVCSLSHTSAVMSITGRRIFINSVPVQVHPRQHHLQPEHPLLSCPPAGCKCSKSAYGAIEAACVPYNTLAAAASK